MQTTKDQLAEFLDRHQAIVCKVARAFTETEADFEDLFQEICIALWSAAEKIPQEVRESTYVYRVALNKAISWRRKRNSYLAHLKSFIYEQRKQPTNQSGGHPHLDQLYAAIRRLSDSDRSIILLYLDEVTTQSMAEILGIAPAAIRKRISRIKSKLATLIQNQEPTDDH